jgi:chromatin structure-remodeling complex subunit RSC1/2
MPENGKISWENNQFTSFRVATKDRKYTAEARLKGQSYRIGDFVHLINPDDPTRPIIGHVFKTYVSTK